MNRFFSNNLFLIFAIGIFILSLGVSPKNLFTKEEFLFPRRVYMTKKAHEKYGKQITEAIHYINNSVKQEIFSLEEGHGGLLIKTSNEEIQKPCGINNQEICITLAYFDPESNKISLLPELKRNYPSSERKLTIAHELLHALGFDHQEPQVLSIVNDGLDLFHKFNRSPNLKNRLDKSLPPHDKEMVLNLFNSQKSIASSKSKQSLVNND